MIENARDAKAARQDWPIERRFGQGGNTRYRLAYAGERLDLGSRFELTVENSCGQWLSTVKDNGQIAVPQQIFSTLEDAKYAALQKAHLIAYDHDGDPGGVLHGLSHQPWDEISN